MQDLPCGKSKGFCAWAKGFASRIGLLHKEGMTCTSIFLTCIKYRAVSGLFRCIPLHTLRPSNRSTTASPAVNNSEYEWLSVSQKDCLMRAAGSGFGWHLSDLITCFQFGCQWNRPCMASSLKGFTNYHGGRTLSSQASAWPGLLQSWAGAFARTPLLECIVRCPLWNQSLLWPSRWIPPGMRGDEWLKRAWPGWGGIRFTCSSTKVLLFFPLLLLPLPKPFPSESQFFYFLI